MRGPLAANWLWEQIQDYQAYAKGNDSSQLAQELAKFYTFILDTFGRKTGENINDGNSLAVAIKKIVQGALGEMPDTTMDDSLVTLGKFFETKSMIPFTELLISIASPFHAKDFGFGLKNVTGKGGSLFAQYFNYLYTNCIETNNLAIHNLARGLTSINFIPTGKHISYNLYASIPGDDRYHAARPYDVIFVIHFLWAMLTILAEAGASHILNPEDFFIHFFNAGLGKHCLPINIQAQADELKLKIFAAALSSQVVINMDEYLRIHDS